MRLLRFLLQLDSDTVWEKRKSLQLLKDSLGRLLENWLHSVYSYPIINARPKVE